MSDAVVYGYCGANCKYEVYSKEQMTAILQQLIDSGSLAGVDPTLSPVVKLIQEQHNSKQLSLWLGTEAEYNALDPQPAASLVMLRTDADGNLYLCTDDSTMQGWYDSIVSAAAEVAGTAISEVTSVAAEANKNAADALAGVEGKQEKHVALSVTLAAASWSSNAQTVTAAGVTADNTVFVSPAPSSHTAYGEAGIICTAQAADSLTFTCESVPAADIAVNVVLLGV